MLENPDLIKEMHKFNPEFTQTVEKGVAALKAGQRQRAKKLFGQVVQLNPNNATAWLWLSRSVDQEQRRQDCLARIRQINAARAARQNHVERPTPEPGGPTSPADQPAPAGQRQIWRPRAARRWLYAAIASLLLVVAGATTPLFHWQSAQAQSEPNNAAGKPLEASGVIRADEVLLASEYGGRITALPVQKGDPVNANDLLVQLDTALLDAQIKAAQAAVALAQAGLAQAQAGARPGQLAIAQAQLAQAQAVRVAAMRAVSDTMLLVRNPQEIQMQIAVMQQQIHSAQLAIEKAVAFKDAAEIGKNEFQDAQKKIEDAGGAGTHRVPVPGAPPGTVLEYTIPSLPLEMHLIPNQWWQAWVGVNAAVAQKTGLEASLTNLYARQTRPQDLQARVDQALAALAQAQARTLAAQAQVDALKAGATPEQIAALETKVEQAQAALDTLISQKAMMTLQSPIDGIVVSLAAHQGEIAAPGATLVAIANLDQVKLTVYLPETQIGHISLGQQVRVAVDSFPNRTFTATITHIADHAEFTPRNVATQEERVNLVFAVELGLNNEDGALKPGMPADAIFGN